ncbi:hypothetical protein T06_5484 [Trichinella sp. T6]|nr:hypothetical protein T06_5484 [Trichinella sp. T6]
MPQILLVASSLMLEPVANIIIYLYALCYSKKSSPTFAVLNASGISRFDDVQAVLGSALTGGCTSWSLLVSKLENSQQMLMVQRTRRRLLCRIWRRWGLFLPRFAFSNLPFFPFCTPSAHPVGSFRFDFFLRYHLRNPEWNI